MADILIAGCGDVGSTLARLLVADGHRVSGLRRRVSRYPPGVTGLVADMCRVEDLADLPSFDQVFYLPSADGGDDESYRRAYVLGLQNLLACANLPRRVFYISSTSVYGQNAGEWVDETSPTEPRRAVARRLLEGEQVAASVGVAQTVVRFAGIYGPGRYRLIQRVVDGLLPSPSSAAFTNRIHRDDCAGFLHHLSHCDEPRALYIAADDEPVPGTEIETWLAAQLQREGSPVAPVSGHTGGLNKRCANGRLRESGYQLRYPNYREGYGDVLKCYFAETPGAPAQGTV